MDGLCIAKGQAAAVECLAQCMQQSWMCILVGPSGSGESTGSSQNSDPTCCVSGFIFMQIL